MINFEQLKFLLCYTVFSTVFSTISTNWEKHTRYIYCRKTPGSQRLQCVGSLDSHFD